MRSYYKNSKQSKLKIDKRIFIRNILFILFLIFIFSIINTVSFGKKEMVTEVYSVKSNTTVWNIANNICSKDTSLNIQNVIYDIKNINNLNDYTIYIGQDLKIPVY